MFEEIISLLLLFTWKDVVGCFLLLICAFLVIGIIICMIISSVTCLYGIGYMIYSSFQLKKLFKNVEKEYRSRGYIPS